MKTESPFDHLESSAKFRYQYQTINRDAIQGKKINFNNIEINNNNNNTHNTNINININYKISNKSENSSISDSKSVEKEITNTNMESNKIACTCTKTNCKKKYCACYASGRYCENCQCENCDNKKPINTTGNLSCGNLINHANIICNCTKSNCKKKYCECYKAGKECSWLCRCVHCENCINRKVKYEDFIIEGIGVEICNNIISVKRRVVFDYRRGIDETLSRIKKEEIFTPMKVTNKKRNRSIKTDSTNFKTANIDSTAKRAMSEAKKKKKVVPKGKKLNI